jgi:hypothetical protein
MARTWKVVAPKFGQPTEAVFGNEKPDVATAKKFRNGIEAWRYACSMRALPWMADDSAKFRRAVRARKI